MTIPKLAALLFACFATVALADAESDIKKVTERFYDQYLEVVDSKGGDKSAWIMKSTHVTPEFKKAYSAAMESGDLDYDPILCAQDTPGKGYPYKASAISVTGETATATMLTGFGDWDKNPLKVVLALRNGAWLIHGINDLKGK